MVLDWLSSALAFTTLAGCFVALIFLAAQIYLIALHLKLRKEGLALEHERLTRPLPPDSDLPHVVVQIPVFNEGAIVERAILTTAQLDWPKDKLHIQICDDSDDETTILAQAAVQRVAKTGLDISVLRRPDRSDFKAGNLRAAIAKTDHDYFAILDVDYVPPKNFLRKCMTVLLADDKLGFVQARPDFLNSGENALTRSQALMLDAHYSVEQATRSWSGQPLPFNGSCGIWRRAAIDAGGGWQGTTLAEDMELSYRIWLKGWRAFFITSVAVPGELPSELNAWASQQTRWMTGSGQVARMMAPIIWHDPRLSESSRFAALLSLMMWWFAPVTNIVFVTSILTLLVKPSLITVVGPAVALMIFCLLSVAFVDLRVGNLFLRGNAASLATFTLDFVQVLRFEFYKVGINIRSTWNAFSDRGIEFKRTPKRGAGTHS